LGKINSQEYEKSSYSPFKVTRIRQKNFSNEGKAKTPDKKERRKSTHLLVLWLGKYQDDRRQWLVASAVKRRPNTKKGCALACLSTRNDGRFTN
jgi:hypothetical protein